MSKIKAFNIRIENAVNIVPEYYIVKYTVHNMVLDFMYDEVEDKIAIKLGILLLIR